MLPRQSDGRRPAWHALVAAGATSLVVGAMTGGALAQELEPGQTVLDRPRPEISPKGVRAGSFLIYPSLAVRETYDSNIFATPDDEEGDFITEVQPTLAAESQWSNHQLNVRVGANKAFYADNTDEDYLDWNVGFDGRVDITRDTNVFGGASWDHEHEDRGSPDDVNGEEPTEFDVANVTAGAFHRFNRVSLRWTNTVDLFDFDDVDRAGGGEINNDDRDRTVYESTLRASYEIQNNFSAFIEGSYNIRDYDSAEDDQGVNRDSDGYSVAVGSAFDLTGVTFGEASVGYRAQDFDDPELDSVDGFSLNASLTSNVTQLTSVQLDVHSSIDETTVVQDGDSASGSFSRGVNLRVDHELLRSVLLNANGRFLNRDYEDIDRVDNTWSAGLGATYLGNRYFDVSAHYNFTSRNSDRDTVEYDKHVVYITLDLAY